MATEVKTLPIEDLTPFERGLVRSRLEQAKKLIAESKNYLKDMRPVEVIEVDGGYVVGDGTHRVAAARKAGKLVVPIKYAWKSNHDIKLYRDALKEHSPLRGFVNMPICENEAERQSLPPPILPDSEKM